MQVRDLRPEDAARCDQIVASLPDWFGLDEVESAEITWIAVHADARGAGVGTELVDELTTQLRREDKRLLFVKTLSDREDPGPDYAATRAFYLARGFVPAAELDLDPPDPENPIQLMVLSLSPASQI